MLETNTSFGAEWRTVEKFWQEQERSTHLAVIELTAWNLIDIPGVQAHRVWALAFNLYATLHNSLTIQT